MNERDADSHDLEDTMAKQAYSDAMAEEAYLWHLAHPMPPTEIDETLPF